LKFDSTLKIPSYWLKLLIGLIIIEALAILVFTLQPIVLFLCGLALAGVLLFYYLFLDKPYLWIGLLVAATALETWGRIANGITFFHVFFILSFMGFLSYSLFTNTISSLIFSTPLNKYFFGYIAVSGISLIYSPNFESGILFITVTIALFLFFITVVNFTKYNIQYILVVVVLLLTNIFITCLIIYQTLKGEFIPGIMDTTVAVGGIKFYRAVGTFEDPNVAATYLASGVILAFSRLLHSEDQKLIKTFYLIGLIFSTIGVFITFSRSAVLFQFIGISVCLIFIKNKKVLKLSFLALLSLVILLFISPIGSLVTERILSIFDLAKDNSIRVRISLISSGLKMFLDSPVWGIGYRGFPVLYDYYIQPNLPMELLYIKESHTLYITLLAELGIIGFTIVLFWFKRVIKDCYHHIDKVGNNRSTLIGAFALFIAFVLNFIYYGNLFPMFNLIWLDFGLIYSVILNSKSSASTV